MRIIQSVEHTFYYKYIEFFYTSIIPNDIFVFQAMYCAYMTQFSI